MTHIIRSRCRYAIANLHPAFFHVAAPAQATSHKRTNIQYASKHRQYLSNDKGSTSNREKRLNDLLVGDVHTTEMITLVKTIQDVKVILEEKKLSSSEVLQLLRKFVDLSQMQNISITRDDYSVFKNIVSLLEDHLPTGDTTWLLSVTECLLKIKIQEDLPILNHIADKLDSAVQSSLKFDHLIRLLAAYHPHRCTDWCKCSSMYLQILHSVHKRIHEAQKPTHLVSLLFYVSDCYTDDKEKFTERYEFLGREKCVVYLHDKIVEMLGNMSGKQLYQVFLGLSKLQSLAPISQTFRSALQSGYMNSLPALTPDQLVKLTHSLAALSVSDYRLIMTVLGDYVACLLKETPASTSSVLWYNRTASVLNDVISLRFDEGKVLDALSEYVLQNAVPEISGDKQPQAAFTLVAKLLECLAALNYHPDILLDTNSLQATLLDYYNQHLNDESKLTGTLAPLDPATFRRQWIQVVWSFVLLNIQCPTLVESVLSPKFINTITASTSMHTVPLTLQRKLLNIHSYASLALHNYAGPLLDEEYMSHIVSQIPQAKPTAFRGTVERIIERIAPNEDYVSWSEKSNHGHIIDGTLVVNSQGLPEQRDMHNPHKLQEGQTHIALQLMDSTSYTAVRATPVGIKQFYINQLQHTGTRVALISQIQFQKQNTDVRKLIYIQNQIKEALGLVT